MIEARFQCPKCESEHRVDNIEDVRQLACPCGWSDELVGGAVAEGKLLRCPLCSTEDMYVQKDFPERIGVLLAVSGVVLASVAWWYYQWFLTFGTLFAFFAVDWVLFHTRKDVTVCYRCLSQFRNMAENPSHLAFDLAIGEKYRQERIRKEQMRAERLAQ